VTARHSGDSRIFFVFAQIIFQWTFPLSSVDGDIENKVGK